MSIPRSLALLAYDLLSSSVAEELGSPLLSVLLRAVVDDECGPKSLAFPQLRLKQRKQHFVVGLFSQRRKGITLGGQEALEVALEGHGKQRREVDAHCLASVQLEALVDVPQGSAACERLALARPLLSIE